MGLEKLLARRNREREELVSRAVGWVEELRSEVDLRAAAVFGSVARGDFNRWSDVDLLLVVGGIEGGPVERADRVSPRPPRVQPVIWTPAEAREALRRENPIAVEAAEAGEWLLGSPEILRGGGEE